MAILNSNPIILNDSGLTLSESVVIGHNFNGVSKIGSADIEMQVDFFVSVEKWQESVSNALKVEGFLKPKNRLNFNYPVDTEQDIFYYFDLQLKDYLMQLFPEWDESKLILTTEPSV
jgi:hypothetical protein